MEGQTIKDFDALSTNEQHDITEYLEDLSLYRIVDNYILVHAAVECRDVYNDSLTAEAFMLHQDRNTLLCDNKFYLDPPTPWIVIFGHVCTRECSGINKFPLEIWHSNYKIGIDCGAGFEQGRIGCLRLDDIQEFYSK